MKFNHRQSLGHRGEIIAANFLAGLGYSIISKNYRTPYGEIDLIANYGNAIIFVEVKTRSSNALGPPEISINRKKAEHMRGAANYYIQEHPEYQNDWRIDVISIQIQPNNAPTMIDHFENAIS